MAQAIKIHDMGIQKSSSARGEGRWLSFFCPGCKFGHHFEVDCKGDPGWDWNRSFINPTFTPSLLVYGGHDRRCHSFVRDGKIQFLDDCTHELKGQTVDLPYIDDGDVEGVGNGNT